MPDPASAPPERLTPLSILAELTYPEYRSRHLFTARLRFLIFIGFWFLYVLAFGERLAETRAVVLTILGAFVVTAICYYNIIADRWLIPSFLLEVAADLVALTTVIYLTGGPASEYYFLYVFYALLAGLFYSYTVAWFLGVASFGAYCAFLWLATHGMIPPLPPAAPLPGGLPAPALLHHPAWAHALWMHPALLAAFLGLTVYAVKVAQQFTQSRERILETRNRELLALQRISGTVRRVAPLEEVVDRVLKGILEGLSFTGCLLMLFDRKARRIVCYPPADHPVAAAAEQILGLKLRDLYLPFEAAAENLLFRQLAEKQVVFRRDLADLVAGLKPPVPAERLQEVQQALRLRKVVAIPLVAEQEVLGALIGFSEEAFVGARVIQTLETFANQGALALQATILIEELKAKNRELEEANRVKSEFLATMSHELRTPLTAIIGFSELLLEGVMGELSEEQQDSLREVLNNGANLLGLINNLLDLAKMEVGKFTLVHERFDLAQLLQRTLRTLGSLITRKQLRFTDDIPADLPPIEADERRIQQVVLNLVGNAIKFTSEGGHIRVEARFCADLAAVPHPAWTAHVRDRQPFTAGCFAIRVSDTGIGIPQAHLESIFEMFRQVDSSVTRSYEGTGLGLALAKQLVEMHAGVIWAESEECAGATFICLLPTAPPKPPAVEPPPLPPEPALHPSFSPIRVPV